VHLLVAFKGKSAGGLADNTAASVLMFSTINHNTFCWPQIKPVVTKVSVSIVASIPIHYQTDLQVQST
jgi:hypothetical protein